MENKSASNGDLSSLSMHDLFRMEAENQTAVLAQGLLDLEKNTKSDDRLEALMRASHSVKGAARIVGIDAVVDIAHELEDCFVAAQRRQISLTSAHIDLLLRAVDTIVQIAHLDEEKAGGWLNENSNIIEDIKQKLAAILSGNRAGLSQAQQLESNASSPAPTQPLTKEADSEPYSRQSIDKRVIRINADQLTSIMGLSSEIMIESGWLRPFTDSMVLLKRRHFELSNLIQSIKESVEHLSVPERTRLQVHEAQKKLTDMRNLLSERLVELDDYDRRNSNLSSKMYHEVVATRMRPLSDATQGLERMVRDIARKLKKKVRLVVEGGDTPVDRDILEQVKAPLTHLVRNAIDHGIETVGARKAKEKDEQGEIKVIAGHAGGMLTIVVEDNGQGVDLNKLRRKITKRNLAREEIVSDLTEAELLQFLFLPDFSTKSRVTEFSGRGIGLDVVRNLVQEMRGTVSISNNAGEGLKLTLQLPLTLSVITTLLVEIAEQPYAFPLSRVDRILSVMPEDIKFVEGRQYVTIDDELVSLVPAAHVLELASPESAYDEFHVIVVSDRLSRYGIVVDRFIGQRELSVQSLDPRLGKVQDISAAALAEDGSPVLIIDVDDLVRSIDAMADGAHAGSLRPYANVMPHKVRKRILVVDDSLTVREIERKLLESRGYRVDVAVDGMDGWNAVRRTRYQLVITDVDMPRMDGIELVNSIRGDHRLKSLPVMIISYKDRQEDRRRGLEAGADYYLAKGSFHDDTLIEAVIDLIGEASE